MVKRQGRGGDAKADPTVRAAQPRDDVVDVEHEIASPVAARRVAEIETQPVKCVVVPPQTVELGPRGRLRHGSFDLRAATDRSSLAPDPCQVVYLSSGEAAVCRPADPVIGWAIDTHGRSDIPKDTTADMSRPARPARSGAIPLALIFVLCFVVPARAQPPGAVGMVATLIGEALVVHHGETQTRPLSEGAPVLEGDLIRTQTGARLRLVLEDGSVLQLGENTSLDVDWVLHAPARGTSNVLLEMSSGIMRAMVEKLVPNALYQVVTHTAVTSVRGTDWIAEAGAAATAIVALDGAVTVRNRAEEIPGEVTLGPGEGTTVEAAAPPDPPAVWGDARRQSFIERTAVPDR